MASSETKSDQQETSRDLPPESFLISRDQEQDWFDRNAQMQRKTSLKLGYNRNFNSLSHPSEVNVNRKTRGSSGFRQQKSMEKKFLFRSRSEPGVKSMVQVSEPGSPRVSCIGRVKSKRGESKKTGFSRLFSSLFRTESRKHVSTKRENDNVG